jgi:hypothetical protein
MHFLTCASLFLLLCAGACMRGDGVLCAAQFMRCAATTPAGSVCCRSRCAWCWVAATACKLSTTNLQVAKSTHELHLAFSSGSLAWAHLALPLAAVCVTCPAFCCHQRQFGGPCRARSIGQQLLCSSCRCSSFLSLGNSVVHQDLQTVWAPAQTLCACMLWAGIFA